MAERWHGGDVVTAGRAGSPYEIEVIDLAPTPAVVLPRTVQRNQLGEDIGRAMSRIQAAVTAARVPVAGAPFVRYLSFGEEIEMEVGLPLTEPQSIPSLRATILPGGPAASTWHLGPYDGLPEAFSTVREWVSENATSAGHPWEAYWTQHDAHPPRTQVVWPIQST
jgi:effector-binding domain-containing protein